MQFLAFVVSYGILFVFLFSSGVSSDIWTRLYANVYSNLCIVWIFTASFVILSFVIKIIFFSTNCHLQYYATVFMLLQKSFLPVVVILCGENIPVVLPYLHLSRLIGLELTKSS